MTGDVFHGMLPSTGVMLVGMGIMVGVVAVVLVQASARMWLYQDRAQRLQDRVAQVEARWRDAT